MQTKIEAHCLDNMIHLEHTTIQMPLAYFIRIGMRKSYERNEIVEWCTKEFGSPWMVHNSPNGQWSYDGPFIGFREEDQIVKFKLVFAA